MDIFSILDHGGEKECRQAALTTIGDFGKTRNKNSDELHSKCGFWLTNDVDIGNG